MSSSTFRVERLIRGGHQQEGNTMAPTLTASAVPGRPAAVTTVPKELVHRANAVEVWLTDWHRADDLNFTVTARLPQHHGFFTAVDGCHDPLMVAETIRQAGILLAHAEFEVPLGHQFLMWDLTVDIAPEHLAVGTAPADVEIEVTCTDVKRRGVNLAGMHYAAVIRRDGQVAATGAATFTCASPAVYRRLRANSIGDDVPAPLPLTSPLAPQDVGRISPTDVVLSPAQKKDSWQLRVDTRHPILFDHPVDHVPGMLLLEAARQASAAFLGHPCLPVGITGEFSRYAELDARCTIEVCGLPEDPHGRNRVLVTGHQDDLQVFSAVVTTVPAED
ncbi:ScbA/BarX family gamma-butyrolactone biosynthesis protein [Streptomyces sp. NPDC050145]|uniref:ScbA/BarX family gamma-butyrolactone biosynthesis protein n=1 Tax=Streptomyces sp. NPDC050145 TaxID=3365602 RepID=UPI0037A30E41